MKLVVVEMCVFLVSVVRLVDTEYLTFSTSPVTRRCSLNDCVVSYTDLGAITFMDKPEGGHLSVAEAIWSERSDTVDYQSARDKQAK